MQIQVPECKHLHIATYYDEDNGGVYEAMECLANKYDTCKFADQSKCWEDSEPCEIAGCLIRLEWKGFSMF